MEEPSERYFGMAAYDLRRYLDLLMIMRDHYPNYKQVHDRQNFDIVTVAIASVLMLGLMVWSILNSEWFVFAASLTLATTLLVRAISKRSKLSEFESDFISRAMKEGYSRADATEFLYDIDWDDVQYEESHIDHIREDLENA